MFDTKFFKVFGVACIAMLALAGCRPEEQGRLLKHEPGKFLGSNPSANLSEQALTELRQRSLLQGGTPAGAGSGGGPKRGGDVRAPGELNEAAKALLQRGKLQSGN